MRQHQGEQNKHSGGAMPEQGRPVGEVQILICMQCGKEFLYETEPPPVGLCCDKCGNGVFRAYVVATHADDVEQEFREETERDLGPEEGPTEVTDDDLRDLLRL
jgi:hypothetical protein